MESIANWLEAHMLACPTKAIFHLDCPGCGFQSAFVDLMRGDFAGVWEHYPPLIPFLLTMLLLIVAVFTRFRFRLQFLMGAFVMTCTFILVNYSLKIF